MDGVSAALIKWLVFSSSKQSFAFVVETLLVALGIF